MMGRSHSLGFITAAMVLSGAFLTGVAALAGYGQGKPPPHNVKSGKYFKNVKTDLKNVPADQLIPIMRNIDASLGVQCDFCHTIENGPGGQHICFEKGTKPMKGIARQMIVMTGEIRKKYKVVKEKVTCFTCHHGRAEPDNTAPAPAPPP